MRLNATPECARCLLCKHESGSSRRQTRDRDRDRDNKATKHVCAIGLLVLFAVAFSISSNKWCSKSLQTSHESLPQSSRCGQEGVCVCVCVCM